jgi:hypothetical protein
MNKHVTEQLSTFGMKPTRSMEGQPPIALSIEIAEITEFPKELMHYDKSR